MEVNLSRKVGRQVGTWRISDDARAILRPVLQGLFSAVLVPPALHWTDRHVGTTVGGRNYRDLGS